MKVAFSLSGIPFMLSRKKKDMKVEYRLLNDIVTKSLTAKVGSFDAITLEQFEMMVAISTEMKVDWASVLFGIFTPL
ncbi:hypothetical protein F511_34558 [Dorcoceras hygrometricum]|uniref:Uncharacterized protein n=1 Tax=Dorcoceras hygrometricum TaxID=472368 RepID=A0A2Z7BCE5_9LAMI|nr:hypothetical protein F511_34558 [Dorcoceras hygrometricum]